LDVSPFNDATPCLSPLSFHRQHHLQPCLTPSGTLCRADLQRGDDDGDAPATPVMQTSPSKATTTCPSTARTPMSRTPTPPSHLRQATPPPADGKPLAASFLLRRRAPRARRGHDGSEPSDPDPAAAWPMQPRWPCTAWPATGPWPFFFFSFHHHLESPTGPAHLSATSTTQIFPPKTNRFENLKTD
jgi:hypothetical protein